MRRVEQPTRTNIKGWRPKGTPLRRHLDAAASAALSTLGSRLSTFLTEAPMALTFTLVDTWDDGKRVHVSGTIAASGNYPTGGDTLDLSQSPIVASSQPPIQGT